MEDSQKPPEAEKKSKKKTEKSGGHRTSLPKKGIGAGASSHRREYRKFRKNGGGEKSTAVCRFFKSTEGCRNGDKCRFQHDSSENPIEVKEEEESGSVRMSETQTLQKQMESMQLEKNPPTAPQIYLPPTVTVNPNPNPKIVPNRPTLPQIVRLKKEDCGGEKQKEQLKAEILYFRRRYRHCKMNDQNGVGSSIDFRYMITDPEWVFDVRSIDFRLVLLPGHPIDIPRITIDESSNKSLPDIVRNFVADKINEAIQNKYELYKQRDAFENIGKALIKWLDHNILTIFVDGLRRTKLVLQAEAAGISLHVPSKKPSVNIENKEEEKQANGENIEQEEVEGDHEEDEEESEDGSDEESDGEDTTGTTSTKKENEQFRAVSVLPIDVALIWNDMSNNVATIRAISMKIGTRCARCQFERFTDVPVTDKVIGWRCEKCSQAESLRIREELVHAGSNVIGRMDSKGCRPIDCVLIDSKFRVVCLACNKEDDMQTLNYGDVHKSWCRGCHTVIETTISHVRFRGNFDLTKEEDRQMAGAIPKPKKIIEKRSAIEEGKPLPNMGTCDHYKKSYRWLRFPCCGKVYPCDICHEEKTGGDHEMKFANRMVCGHCSKEQPFQKDKPCAGCGGATTRRRTQFWEGGKGCRDQTKMNRNDGHKFVNSKKKTVAKSKVEELATKNKKT